jgi:hypothetical protein
VLSENRAGISVLLRKEDRIMGVTAIRRIENRSTIPFSIWNMESRWQYVEVPPGTYLETEIWIPWCTSAWGFPGQHLRLNRGGFEWAMWQADRRDGDHVRISKPPQYWNSGHLMDGVSVPNGDRRLVVSGQDIKLYTDFPELDLPGA